MTHFYNTSHVKKKDYFSRKQPDRQKVMSMYVTHYRNRCLLDRLLLSVIDDLKEKYQVGLEIAICDRKLDYWRNHALWSLDSTTVTKLSQIKTACLSVNF
jgi:hypothetical protein